MLEAGLRQARGAATEVAGLIDDLNLRAPTGGVVLNRLRENGEMVAAVMQEGLTRYQRDYSGPEK